MSSYKNILLGKAQKPPIQKAPPLPKEPNQNTNWLSKIQINESVSPPTPPPSPPFEGINSPGETPPRNIYVPPRAVHIQENPNMTQEELNALIAEDPAAYLFLPETLFIDSFPFFIHSQHFGECATDSFLNILFFADDYRKYFARKADAIYRKLRVEGRSDLLHYTDRFRDEVVQFYGIQNTRHIYKYEFNEIITIFSMVVRRYILLKLMDNLNSRTINKLSEIIETKCPLPYKVKNRYRRRSINAKAGIEIHDAILEYLGMNSRQKLPNKQNELETKGLLPTHVATVIRDILSTLINAQTSHFQYQVLPFEEPNLIEHPIPNVRAIYIHVDPPKESDDRVGHIVSLFMHNKEWYLADNNIGMVLPVIDFNVEEFCNPGPNAMTSFFVGNLTNIDLREFLSGNNGTEVEGFPFQHSYVPFLIERLRNATFYGYRIYPNKTDPYFKQIVIAIFWIQRLYSCPPMQEIPTQGKRIYFFSDLQKESNTLTKEPEDIPSFLNRNTPQPFKRTQLKKTKRRARSKGKRRTTLRAKPTKINKDQANNLRNAIQNASNEAYNEHMMRYFNTEKRAPKLTLGNFV